jgi:hypothetical protein
MSKKKWKTLPGGRAKRWKKSRSDFRPGGGTTRFVRAVPPHWYRNMLNRRERRRSRTAILCGAAGRAPYVHPREAAWYW